ncbi:cell wall anchor protein, partial [Bacillus thuringiensis]|nr:cell wall anchor protein [Bacillus thuringiensis]
ASAYVLWRRKAA